MRQTGLAINTSIDYGLSLAHGHMENQCRINLILVGYKGETR